MPLWLEIQAHNPGLMSLFTWALLVDKSYQWRQKNMLLKYSSVKNKNIRTRCKICLKITKKPEQSQNLSKVNNKKTITGLLTSTLSIVPKLLVKVLIGKT